MYTGRSKLMLKHLKFLLDEYGFDYSFQTFDSFCGFPGPIDTYSFYNQHGCFTLQHIVQRGEWELYTSRHLSTKLSELLDVKIDLLLYISHPCWRCGTLLKRLSHSIRKQVSLTSFLFGIQVTKE